MSVLGPRALDGSIGAYSATESVSSLFQANGEWTAASVDKRFFVADRAMAVQSVSATVTVAGTDGGAVTAIVREVPSGTAIGSGVALHERDAKRSDPGRRRCAGTRRLGRFDQRHRCCNGWSQSQVTQVQPGCM